MAGFGIQPFCHLRFEQKHIPQKIGDRSAPQVVEAELPANIFLRGERQRHQDTGSGHTDRKSAHDGHSKADATGVSPGMHRWLG